MAEPEHVEISPTDLVRGVFNVFLSWGYDHMYAGVPENLKCFLKGWFIIISQQKEGLFGYTTNFQTHPDPKNRVHPMQWNVHDMLTCSWEMGIKGPVTFSFEPAEGQKLLWTQYWSLIITRWHHAKSNDRPPHLQAFPKSHEPKP